MISGVDIHIVVEIDEKGYIGKDGDIPWTYPLADAHIKDIVEDEAVLMGRKTLGSPTDVESLIEKPYPNSSNLILSTGDYDLPEDVVSVSGVSDAAHAATSWGYDRLYILGGKLTYASFLPHTDRLLFINIPEEIIGGVSFPVWDRSDWILKNEKYETPERNYSPVTFDNYERMSD